MTFRRRFLPFFLISLTLIGFLPVNIAYADDDKKEESLDIDKLEDKIKKYEKKLEELEKEGRSLQNEIDYANGQIYLTELRIQNATHEIAEKETQIDKLSSDIEDLKDRIFRLEDSITYQSKILSARKRSQEKIVATTPSEVEFLLLLFDPTRLKNKLRKIKYSEVMQVHDKALQDEMTATKIAYDRQKGLFETKKQEEEVLKEQLQSQKVNLESYKITLNKQKADKEELLKKTENDEAKYQALLAQVRSELAALQLALDLPEGDGSPVEKGDVIGYMGNTGCSTGPHLHFGYIRDGSVVDPLPYLEKGKLKWPVKNWSITQYFGENYSFYMRNFGIPGHDAIDMISTSQWSGAPIKAAKDGVLYYATDSKVYCPWLNNSYGNGAIIDHGDGERTIYWHLQ